jgi:arylsulfatase A-like enzyme
MSESATRPNVLCFVVDQMRYDHMGCTGNEMIETPHLDRLADEGVLFERNYVTHPACMPARATLFSGRPPRENGVRANGTQLPDAVETVPELLGEAGYSTHAAGKLHFGNYSLPFPQIAYMIHEGALLD